MPVFGAVQAWLSGATHGDGASGFGCARVMVYNVPQQLRDQT
jgi:hypothetical protein